MAGRPTYKELEQKVKLLDEKVVQYKNEIVRVKHELTKFAMVLFNVPLFMMIVDQKRRVKKVSDSILQFTGRTEKEMLGLRGGEALRCVNHIDNPKGCGFGSACDSCVVRLTIEDTLKTGNNHFRVESKLPFIDDLFKERTLLISTSLIEQPDKQVAVYLEDITERKHADKALKESEEKYRNLFENTGTATFVAQEDMTVTQVNAKCEVLSGYSREEIVGKMKTTDFVSADELEKIKTYHFERRKKNDDIPSEYEIKLVDKNGNIKNVIIQVGLIPDTTKSIASLIDITPLKQAEKTLRKSEERFRNLTEITSDWIWEVDKNSCYTYASPKIYDMLGYDPEEIIGKTPFDLMPPDESDRVSKIFNNMAASYQLFSCFENINIHKDGHPVVLETSGIPIFDSDGKFCGYRGIDRDITERKQIEEELRKSHDELEHRVKERTKELEIKTKNLEELNTALEVLLKKREGDKKELEGNVLANVKGMIEPYFKKIKKTKLDDEQKVLLGIIESNLREIISPFASKLSSKYINLTPTEIKVADFVKHGKRNKEIASFLNLSTKTIESHRESIRKKVGIKNTKTNLRSYLLSLR